MAKYNRFDPKNKKKDRHKNKYLDQPSKGKTRKDEYNEESFEERMLSKYT